MIVLNKILKVIGYILLGILFLIGSYVFLFSFLLGFHLPVQIFCIFMIVLTLVMQFIHWKKTREKKVVLRIIISFVFVVVISFLFKYCYYLFKSYEGNKILDSINSLYFDGYTYGKDELVNAKVRFVSDKFLLTKGSSDLVIYYDDGNIENSYVLRDGYIFVIKGDKYYIDGLDFEYKK